MILCLYSIATDQKDSAIFSDLEVGDLRQDGQRMNKAELFDEESIKKLEKVGIVVNLNQGVGTPENQFVQVIKDKHMISGLTRTVNACLDSAATVWNDKENLSHKAIQKMHVMPFSSIIAILSKYHVGMKYGTIKVRADLVEEGQKNEWISYNPNKHGHKPLSKVLLKILEGYFSTDYSNMQPELTPESVILRSSDPMGLLTTSNTLRIVDVRNGNNHDDKYNTEKRDTPVKCNLIPENESTLVEKINNDEESVAIGSLFDSILSYCKAVKLFQENDDDVPVAGEDGSS